MLLATCSLAVAKDAKPDPQEKLETAIPEAIRLLEKKDYATLLKNFVAPDDLKKVTENKSLDEFAKAFGESHADKLLTMLKSVKDAKPEMEEKGTKATYKSKEPNGMPLVFQKVGKRWYIQN